MEQASDIDVIPVRADLIFTDPEDWRRSGPANAGDQGGAEAQSAFVRDLLAGPASAADREFLAGADAVSEASGLVLGPWEPVARDGWATSLARDGRAVLVISSRVTLPRGQRCRVESSNPSDLFLPDHIVLIDANDWFVNDVLINDRSQLRNGGDLAPSPFDAPAFDGGIPGFVFAPGAADNWLQLQVAQKEMRIAIDVTYVGPANGGALTCLMLGRAVASIQEGAGPAIDAPVVAGQAT